MLQHGHIDAAFDYVIQCDVPFSFPFGYAGNLMQKLDDQRRITCSAALSTYGGQLKTMN